MAGVIGYIAQMSMPEASTPSATAVLPLITTCGTVDFTAGTRYLKSRCFSAQFQPASSSATLDCTTFRSFLPKMNATCSRARFMSRLNTLQSMPSTNMFLPLRGSCTSARHSCSIGTSMTR
ncbi:MAG: hypothetical protein K0R70_1753 [Steroidobacteraceae bacterium]|nr:hypothetical protein [Steroidobacteraceae bacterium]